MAEQQHIPQRGAYKLSYDGGVLDLDYTPATEGAGGLNIAALMKTTGDVTLDSGFMNTASCASDITYIDGDAGILRYRGYSIEDLAEKSSFLEVCYLLIDGELPTAAQLADFTHRVTVHTMVHEDVKNFFSIFHRDAHPMPVLSSAVSAMSTFYDDCLDPFDPSQVHIATMRLLAKGPTLASYAYKRAIGEPLRYPDNSLGYVENFLHLTFGVPAEPYEVDPKIVKALEMLFILHADHEQNCSTSTVRMVGSSHANLFASVSAGINALYGPRHGGANQAVLEMLQTIQERGLTVDQFVAKIKDRADGLKLMGFGHRVYKSYDPRAAIVKKYAHGILQDAHMPFLDIALELEERALSDDYFTERQLYPNVDFYTGLLYRAMKFPTNMFTVLFALGRMPGWIAQWREMIEDPTTKIGRPRQVYTGAPLRQYVAVEDRG